MKIYVMVFQNGVDGMVMQAFYNKDTAESTANKLNGKGTRYGTYEVIEADVYEDKKENNCKDCFNYNSSDGIDDIRKCKDCEYN